MSVFASFFFLDLSPKIQKIHFRKIENFDSKKSEERITEKMFLSVYVHVCNLFCVCFDVYTLSYNMRNLLCKRVCIYFSSDSKLNNVFLFDILFYLSISS